MERGFALILSRALILLAFYFLFSGPRVARKEFDEITEYRDRGTINGIKAGQIFDNP